MSHFVTHLESAIDGTKFPFEQLQSMHLDRPLWVRYDLGKVAAAMEKRQLQSREPTMWRYRELLPVGNDRDEITLGEGMSPLVRCGRSAHRLGLQQFWIKDESQLPTGSFKSRGLAMAITMAKKRGVQSLAMPTAGNAGGAAAAYATRAGLPLFVFMPKDTPVVNQYEAKLMGANVFLIDGLINDCGRIVREGMDSMGWFDLSTLKEPYRIEGKKTMGLELAEQFQWELPDVVVYPTGGGTGLIGMWKAFNELKQMNWLAGGNLPRMVSVQSDGCCPIVRAYEQGDRFATPFSNAQTVASGLRVPAAVGDFMILDAVRESGGIAVAVDEQRLIDWTRMACRDEGISVCPETAACIGAVEQLTAENWIAPHERVVVFNTGAVQKYVEVMETHLPFLDHKKPIDWQSLAGS